MDDEIVMTNSGEGKLMFCYDKSVYCLNYVQLLIGLLSINLIWATWDMRNILPAKAVYTYMGLLNFPVTLNLHSLQITMCHVSRNCIWCRVQIMNLLIVYFSPGSFRSKYSPHHPPTHSFYVLPVMWETKFHIHTKSLVKLVLCFFISKSLRCKLSGSEHCWN